MDAAAYLIPEEKIPKAEKYARNFLVGYVWLAFAAYVEGQKLFKIRPKILGPTEAKLLLTTDRCLDLHSYT